MQYAKCNYLTAIEIKGTDALSFLQGQLTCDVEAASHTQCTLAAHCNIKGRMVSLGLLCKIDNTYLYILPDSIAEKALKHLKKYGLFSKITLSINHDYHFYGVQAELEKAEFRSEKSYIFTNQLDSRLRGNDTTKTIQVPGNNRTLVISTEDIAFEDATETPETWWQAAELENGIPFLTAETSGEFLPHDINLPKLGGVSFQKGCFLGQEIVARMEYLGKLKKHMVFERLNNPAATTDEKVIASVRYQEKLYRLILQ